MSKHPIPPLLALLLVLALAASGCIEARDKPENGEFSIELHSRPMFFVPDEGGELEGAHAHVETDLHHEHPDYSWNITGVGVLGGSKVEVPATEVGTRRVGYVLEYYEQSNRTSVLLATVPDLSGVYLAVGNGSDLEDHGHAQDRSGVVVQRGPQLETVHSGERGHVMEFTGLLRDPINVNVTMEGEGSAAYVAGIHVRTVSASDQETGSVRIYEGELHDLSYADGELTVTISPEDDPGNVTFSGAPEDLPERYRTHIGSLEWHGEVGEAETPGMGSVVTAASLAMAALVVARRGR